ncbi:MAG: hypothetical protein K6E40_09895 [Desulfovibrio sp.]|nr:hypothetical protein [Desulfovibrio sp.]
MTAIEWICLALFAVSLAVFLLCFRHVEARQCALEGRVYDLERHEDAREGDVHAVQSALRLLESLRGKDAEEAGREAASRHLALCERIDALASRVDELERPARAEDERGMLRAEVLRRS